MYNLYVWPQIQLLDAKGVKRIVTALEKKVGAPVEHTPSKHNRRLCVLYDKG